MKNQKAIQALEAAIKIAGGSSALAGLIGVTASLPSMWRTRGQIPIANCPAIERATKGAVTRRDLRPNDWHLIWPELEKTESNPCQTLANKAQDATEYVGHGAAHG